MQKRKKEAHVFRRELSKFDGVRLANGPIVNLCTAACAEGHLTFHTHFRCGITTVVTMHELAHLVIHSRTLRMVFLGTRVAKSHSTFPAPSVRALLAPLTEHSFGGRFLWSGRAGRFGIRLDRNLGVVHAGIVGDNAWRRHNGFERGDKTHITLVKHASFDQVRKTFIEVVVRRLLKLVLGVVLLAVNQTNRQTHLAVFFAVVMKHKAMGRDQILLLPVSGLHVGAEPNEELVPPVGSKIRLQIAVKPRVEPFCAGIDKRDDCQWNTVLEGEKPAHKAVKFINRHSWFSRFAGHSFPSPP